MRIKWNLGNCVRASVCYQLIICSPCCVWIEYFLLCEVPMCRVLSFLLTAICFFCNSFFISSIYLSIFLCSPNCTVILFAYSILKNYNNIILIPWVTNIFIFAYSNSIGKNGCFLPLESATTAVDSTFQLLHLIRKHESSFNCCCTANIRITCSQK